MTRSLRLFAVLTIGALAGCGAPSDDATDAIDPVAAPEATTPPSDPDVREAPSPCDADNDISVVPGSLPPFDSQPRPGAMPAGILDTIVESDNLVVGVDQNTLGFGWRNRDGVLEGFDIRLAEEIGLAMFGEPGHVDLLPVISAQRVRAVQSGRVDLVISVMSITCDRAEKVAFSAAYFSAGQRVLVQGDSDIGGVGDLAGRTVCATTSSTSLVNLEEFAPEAVPYEVPARTDCLVALQQGRVDAISTDDTILRGFMAQDPKLELLPVPPFSNEQYGIAIAVENDDLVRFVNGVLEGIRADGSWAELLGAAEAVLGDLDPPSDTPPEPVYVEDT